MKSGKRNFLKDFDRWVEYYDELHGLVPDDRAYYLKLAERTKGKVLELACGTGRVYLDMLAAGVDAYGLDISKGMLSELKRKAIERGLKPKVTRADMVNFQHSASGGFQLVVCPFRSFLHITKQADQLAALKNVRRHLKKGGIFALNFFYPRADVVANTYGKEVPHGMDEGADFECIIRSDFADEIEQVVEFYQKFVRRDSGRTMKKLHFRLAFIYKREFELLLTLAGFSKWKVYGGFKKEKLTSSLQEMVWEIYK